METKLCLRCKKPIIPSTKKSGLEKKFCDFRCRTRYNALKKYREMTAKDPEWNARRQREYYKKNPERVIYNMAKCYLGKLPRKIRYKLLREINKRENEKVQK